MPFSADQIVFSASLFFLGVGILALIFLCCVLYLHRRRLREALLRLAESEDRFRTLFEYGGVGLALLSAEGVIVQANPALEQMLGYGRAQLNGRRLSDLSHPDDRGDDTRRMRRQPPSPAGDQWELERRYLRKDGGVVWARVVRAAVRDDAGTVCYHASVLMDVTERSRAEEALRKAEEVLRQERDFIALVLQTADALVVVTDRDGRVVRFNAKCAALSGCSEEAARGRSIWEFLPSRAVDSVRAGYDRLAGFTTAAGIPQPSTMEFPWSTPDGGERLIAWRPSLVFEPSGGVQYVIGVGLDITEQRRLEEQAGQSQKLETLATLVEGIAHDFNNQLTSVIGNLNLAAEDLRVGAEGAALDATQLRNLRSWAEAAEEAAQRCAGMTARLLTFSRGRIGSRRLLHLNQLLPEAVRLLGPELPPSVRVKMEAADDIWPIDGDWARLHQTMHALALNARDAMPKGGVLTLALANRVLEPAEAAADLEARPGRFVELRVQDDGVGMTPEVRGRLFEPFFTTKPPGRGGGLGLSEVYGIVKGHQGWIKVETAPGRGSVFRIYLPATRPLPSPEPSGEGGSGECVLIVDDEDSVRELARLTLERRGYRVLTACDGEDGLKRYAEHPGRIDLVLLDYSMPGLTGLEVFHELRKMDPKTSVLFSSGYGLQGDAAPLLAAGACAFVPKPYRPDELVQAVRQVLAVKNAPG
jgi:PAS domain S-box-containing protein